jgi:hypothetical protein
MEVPSVRVPCLIYQLTLGMLFTKLLALMLTVKIFLKVKIKFIKNR